MSYIECKCDGIKEDNFYGKTEVFPVGTSGSELLWSLDSTIIGVADSYKVWETLGSKYGTSLGVYEWSI